MTTKNQSQPLIPENSPSLPPPVRGEKWEYERHSITGGWYVFGIGAPAVAFDLEDDAKLVCDCHNATLALPDKEKEEFPVINLGENDWNEIQKAASESNWMPPEYCRNDWVSDVCAFLRGEKEASEHSAHGGQGIEK